MSAWLNERISESAAAAAAVDVVIAAGTATCIVAMSEDINPLNDRSYVRCGRRDVCSCQNVSRLAVWSQKRELLLCSIPCQINPVQFLLLLLQGTF